MKAQYIVWTLTIGVTLVAAFVDFRTHKIPNWLTVPAFFLGLTVRTLISGWSGAKASLEGLGLGLIILLPLVLMRALGAGDWKLMGAVGALLGPEMFLFVLLASVFLSGLMAIAMMIFIHRVKTTLRNLF